MCASRVSMFQWWLGLDVVQLSSIFSTGELANLGLKMGSFRKRMWKRAMQHAVEQNQDCQDQVAPRQRTTVGVGVALGLGPPTTQRRPPACRPPAGKAHRSYTSLPHITILILLILHALKTHRLRLCPHITICFLVVSMCPHTTKYVSSH